MYDTSWFFATFRVDFLKITVINIPKHRGFWMSVLEKDEWLFLMQLCSRCFVHRKKTSLHGPRAVSCFPQKSPKISVLTKRSISSPNDIPFWRGFLKITFWVLVDQWTCCLRCWTWDHEAQIACYLYSQLQKRREGLSFGHFLDF